MFKYYTHQEREFDQKKPKTSIKTETTKESYDQVVYYY